MFFFVLFACKASGQVVSGKVGIFRDSVYVNGKWYNRFFDSTTLLPFNNVLLSSENGRFVKSVGMVSDTVFTNEGAGKSLVGVDSSDVVRVLSYGLSTFYADTSFSHSPIPFYWDNGSVQLLLTNSTVLFTTSDKTPSQFIYQSHSGQFYPTFLVDDSSFLVGNFRNDVGFNPIQLYKEGGNSNAAKINFYSQIPDSPVTNQGGIFMYGNSYIYSGLDASKNILKILPDSSTSFYLNGNSYFGGVYGIADSILTVNGGGHFAGGLFVNRNLNLYNNFVQTAGRVYIRIPNAVLTNNNSAADINLQGAVIASTYALNTDSLVMGHLYTIQGKQGTPTVLYVYNSSGVNDTIDLPPLSYMFNLGQNVSSVLGSSYDVVICNFTPSNISQQVIVFPNPVDAGATINGASSLEMPASSVRRFRGWVVGSNEIWLAY